ncbi:MAG: septum formation initiator family protein [Oscillospiraceae bacterium]|jgi:cell division protein FtsB|nr:septum formation initiator family protein [Oscillospiraceae bacterium]
MKLKRADFITKLVLVLILLFAVGMTVTIRSKTEELRTEIEALHSRAAELEIENAELEYYVEHQDDDDVIGNIARKYWGFVRPDEKVYYDSND